MPIYFEGVVKEITDRVNSSLTYTGIAKSSSASVSDPVWRVSRVITQGTLTTTEYADHGNYNQVFEDRETLFPVPEYANMFSLLFDGINDSVSFGNSFLYDRTNPFSLSMWIKPGNLGARQTLYAKATADANVYGWGFYLETSGKIAVQARTSSSLTSGTGTNVFTVGAWQHLLITYNGASNISGIRIYRNGVVGTPPASQTLTGTLLLGQESYLGVRNTSFQYTGNIDEVGFWGAELTGPQVLEVYNGGVPISLTNLSSSGSLQHSYAMGGEGVFPDVPDQVGTSPGTANNMTVAQVVQDTP